MRLKGGDEPPKESFSLLDICFFDSHMTHPYLKDFFSQARLNLKTSKGCQNQDADHINLEHVTVGNGVVVQVETIPLSVFQKVDLFYCCITCGKVFWEGKHFEQVCSQFSHVINTNQREEDATKGSYASEQQY